MADRPLLDKPILHLNLKRVHFENILQGKKHEEYREVKPHWNKILGAHIKIKGRHYHPSDVIICFANGYQKERPEFLIECRYCIIKDGISRDGLDPKKQYWALGLGKILWKDVNHSPKNLEIV